MIKQSNSKLIKLLNENGFVTIEDVTTDTDIVIATLLCNTHYYWAGLKGAQEVTTELLRFLEKRGVNFQSTDTVNTDKPRISLTFNPVNESSTLVLSNVQDDMLN